MTSRDRDRPSRRVPLKRHRSLRKSLRDHGQLSHFWKAHRLDMVQDSQACAAFTETSEPLITYFDVSEGWGVPSPGRAPQTPRNPMSGPQCPNTSRNIPSC